MRKISLVERLKHNDIVEVPVQAMIPEKLKSEVLEELAKNGNTMKQLITLALQDYVIESRKKK